MFALVLCLVTMLTLLATLRSVIALQVESVFAPLGSRKVSETSRMQNTSAGHILLWASTFVWAISLTVLTLYIESAGDEDFFMIGLLWLAAIFARRVLAVFVNWVFFPVMARRDWECVYRLAVTVNALLATATMLIAVCNEIDAHTTLVITILAHVPALLVTMWGCWRLFFGNLLGSLHFLLYLCTLECLLPVTAVAVHDVIIKI